MRLPNPDTVQQWSLPIEMIGLFLAMVEIYRPRHSMFLEDRIDRVGGKILSKSIFHNFRQYASSSEAVGRAIAKYAVIGIISGTLALLMLYVTRGTVNFIEKGAIRNLVFFSFFLGIANRIADRIVRRWMNNRFMRGLIAIMRFPFDVFLLVVVLIVRAIGQVVRVFNRFGNGRAIGGIGISLSGVGLMGEVYQVLMLDDDEITRFTYWSAICVLVALMLVVLFAVNRMMRKRDGTVLATGHRRVSADLRSNDKPRPGLSTAREAL